jgi:RecB family exonuclease
MGIDQEHQGYVDSFRRWFDMVVDTVILTEERLMDMDFSYHGQIDLLVRSKEGTVDLVDLKTPAAAQKSWKVQLAGYRHLLAISEYPTPDRAGSLRLDKDGRVPRMEWYQNNAQDLCIFTSALNCYRFFNS